MTGKKTQKKSEPADWKLFIIALILCQGAGIIGSIFTFDAIPTWYATLAKPWFSPPNWIFGPVWITLYFMMACSLYLIWKSKPSFQKGFTEKVFYTQLILNAAWSILFFGLQNPMVAFAEIVIMWITILLTLLSAWKLNKTAGILLIPYILWVSFASILNLSIVLLN